ncbi:sel1 repeat family protein [Mesorhizobium sp. B2-7-1]|nr:sel1 repeat family protein [Mesorhizobium sp. B2-7-1]
MSANGLGTLSNFEWPPRSQTAVYSPRRPRPGPALCLALVVLAGFVLFGPALNYYQQWSAIKKARAANLAKDYAEEYRQLSLLADTDNPDGQYKLGVLYWQGLGVAQDRQHALDWWRKAADGGNAQAAYAIGRAYYVG